MRNSLLFSILVFLAINTSFAQNLSSLYQKVNSSVVVIKAQGKEGESKNNSSESLGSGVLVSDDGLIWTASHVVHSSEKILVKFTDGDIYNAVVLSSNPMADVALIKIESGFEIKNKHIAIIGDSDKVLVGDNTFIIGAPLGVEQTLSKGIISGRMLPDNFANDFFPIEFLQTDAAINPGNSGGPIFNMKGEVIAIASFILSQTGGFNGIGFGASSNVANKLLMEQENFWSGIESVILSDELADIFNLPQEAGILVLSVSSNSLGNEMELRGGFIKATIEGKEILLGGDVLLEIAGLKLDSLENISQLRNKLISIEKGESYIVKYLRAGQIRIKAIIKK